MRILQVAPLFGTISTHMAYGSIERVIVQSSYKLQELGHQVTICALMGSRFNNIELLPVEALPDDYSTQASTIAEKVQQGEYDVLHTHNAKSLSALITHGVSSHCRIFSSIHGPAERSAYRYVPLVEHSEVGVIALANYQARQLENYFPIRGVAPNGVDEDFYKPDLETEKEDYILTLGRVAPEKGIEEAILIARQVGIHIRIAGPVLPNDQPYFDDRIRPQLSDKYATYLGSVTDAEKLPLLQRAKALMQLTQVPETSSLSVLESLACGTPVIASAKGSLPDMVQNDITGYVCPDQSSCISALGSLPSFDRLAVRAAILKQYSWQKTAEKLESIYSGYRR